MDTWARYGRMGRAWTHGPVLGAACTAIPGYSGHSLQRTCTGIHVFAMLPCRPLPCSRAPPAFPCARGHSLLGPELPGDPGPHSGTGL